jgi:hypothetical protein
VGEDGQGRRAQAGGGVGAGSSARLTL